jgi:hypothetical protein
MAAQTRRNAAARLSSEEATVKDVVAGTPPAAVRTLW